MASTCRRTWTTTLGPALAVAMLATFATPTRADEATDKAKAAFKEGSQHYRLGHFDEALAAYERAYEYRPLAEFLFNIGQCHFNLGHHERAIFFYESFLRERPDAPNRDVVETQLAESRAAWEQAQAAQRAEQQQRLEEEERARAEAEGRTAEEQRRLQEERRRTAEAEAEALNARANIDGVDPWLLWSGVGATAAVITAAAIGSAVLAITLTTPPQTVPPAGSMGTIDTRTLDE